MFLDLLLDPPPFLTGGAAQKEKLSLALNVAGGNGSFWRKPLRGLKENLGQRLQMEELLRRFSAPVSGGKLLAANHQIAPTSQMMHLRGASCPFIG